MPNQRITFRVPPELLEQLPANADERSQTSRPGRSRLRNEQQTNQNIHQAPNQTLAKAAKDIKDLLN